MSGYTSTQIISIALDAIGESPLLEAGDNRPAAKLMKRNYPHTLDRALRAHSWNFATRRQAIPALVEPPAYGFRYQYPVPADSLRVLPVTHNGEFEGRPVVYKVERGPLGTVIVTNEKAPLKVRYIARVGEDAFPPDFADAVAMMLAYRAASPITGKGSLKGDLEEEADRLIKAAIAADALEDGTQERPVMDSWTDGRFGGGDSSFDPLDGWS